jgi:ClpP class serine protease
MATQHRLSSKNLDLILHSSGGSSEAAEQIVGYLRSR